MFGRLLRFWRGEEDEMEEDFNFHALYDLYNDEMVVKVDISDSEIIVHDFPEHGTLILQRVEDGNIGDRQCQTCKEPFLYLACLPMEKYEKMIDGEYFNRRYVMISACIDCYAGTMQYHFALERGPMTAPHF
jgi:hypothetical protein